METTTRWYHLVAWFFGAAFLTKAFPSLCSPATLGCHLESLLEPRNSVGHRILFRLNQGHRVAGDLWRLPSRAAQTEEVRRPTE